MSQGTVHNGAPCLTERQHLAQLARKVGTLQARAAANALDTGDPVSCFERGQAHAFAVVASLIDRIRAELER